MLDKPFFSIVIPTYNRARDLELAINKILVQNYKNFEIVVSDNCSTDNTSNVVYKFGDRRIRYYRNKKNLGVYANIQKAIDRARGRYIFLHSDDDFIIYSGTFKKVKQLIDFNSGGYIRLNYLSLSKDKKNIFDFRASKEYDHNVKLKPNQAPKKIIDFLLASDCSFITGIIFKNELPKDAVIIDTHLYAWFPIIYYAAERFGAYFISKPYILASWSEWKFGSDTFHPLYSLVDGKLTSENYLRFVKKKLSESEYRILLGKQLMGVYVQNFPSIKLYTGNKSMLELVQRLRDLDQTIVRKTSFRIKLIFAFITPKIILSVVRKFYLAAYIKRFDRSGRYKKIIRYVK